MNICGIFCEKSLIESDPQTHVALASGLLICINKKKGWRGKC